MQQPSPRAISRALAVLQSLPPTALAMLAERLIEQLDALDAPGIDLEPDDDGEGDDDGEAAPWEGDATWAPTTGPADCSAVRLARAA